SDIWRNYKGHVLCVGCVRPFPLQEDSDSKCASQCAMCSKYSCHKAFSRCVRPLRKPSEWTLGDYHVAVLLDGYGPVERDLIVAYLQEKNLSQNTLPAIITGWLRALEPDNCIVHEEYGNPRRLDPDVIHVDYECAMELVRKHLQNWW